MIFSPRQITSPVENNYFPYVEYNCFAALTRYTTPIPKSVNVMITSRMTYKITFFSFSISRKSKINRTIVQRRNIKKALMKYFFVK